MMLFHPEKNIGRDVIINGKKRTISSVTKDKKTFRIEDERFGVVHDYDARHVQEAAVLTISLNNGETWLDIPFIKA